MPFALPGPCAVARAGGVHFDPESPAGKEYGLPLPEARGEGLGSQTGGSSGRPPPLFGIGVSGPPPAPSRATGGVAEGGPRGQSHGREGRSATSPGGRRVNLPPARSYSPADGTAIVIGLLLLVGLLGYALRRGYRIPSAIE